MLQGGGGVKFATESSANLNCDTSLSVDDDGKKYKYGENTNLAYLFFKKSCLYNNLIPGVWYPFVEDYTTRVKEVFGWTNPIMFRNVCHMETNVDTERRKNCHLRNNFYKRHKK